MFKENLECVPLVVYGKAKIAFSEQAKALCKGTGMRFLHARIFSVYGVDDHPWSLIYTSVTRILRNEPLDLSACLHKWNFMAVEDTADLLLTLYEQRDRIPLEDNCIFIVATNDIRPLREFIESIRILTGSASELRFGAFKQGAESAMSIMPDMTMFWRTVLPFSRKRMPMLRNIMFRITRKTAIFRMWESISSSISSNTGTLLIGKQHICLTSGTDVLFLSEHRLSPPSKHTTRNSLTGIKYGAPIMEPRWSYLDRGFLNQAYM